MAAGSLQRLADEIVAFHQARDQLLLGVPRSINLIK